MSNNGWKGWTFDIIEVTSLGNMSPACEFLVRACKEMAALGGMPNTSGNVAMADPEMPEMMFVTASGIEKAKIDPEQIVAPLVA